MRFLIIGLGSAGQRHARAIRSLFPNAIIDVFVGKRKIGLISNDLKQIDYSVSPIRFYHMNEIDSFNQLEDKYDLTIIATPIASHYEYFEKTRAKSKRIIIEKPIGDRLSDAEKIRDAVIEENLPLLIGYQHNFNPLVHLILAESSKRCIPNSLNLTFHEYLRDMNTFRDMSNHHLAQPNGGGVLLALSHEIDIAMQISKLQFSDLTAEFKKSEEFPNVFDQVLISNRPTASSHRKPKVSISLSFAAGKKSRIGRIEWDKESLSWDFVSSKATLEAEGRITELIKPDLSGDELIIMQLIFVLNKSSFDNDLRKRLDRALDILRIDDAAKIAVSRA